jgi:hypothetical protein
MQHAQETDLRAEMLGIGGDFQQRGRAGAEQNVVYDLLVLQSQPGKFMRKSEDQVEIADRQEFPLTLCQPAVASTGQTLRAMTITAGVIGDGAIVATRTTVEMAAQSRGAAVRDGLKHASVVPRQPGTIPLDETAS